MARTSSKRRDKKDRVLEKGEYQKDSGVYEYRYKDIYGKTRSIYSWRLTASDPQPKGKAPCEPLRDMKVAIDKDKHNHIDTFASKSTTLNERFDLYMESKYSLRKSTRENYLYMYNKYVRGELGRMKIGDINYSILLRFYSRLITKHGFMPNSVSNIHTILNPVFDIAVLDKLILANDCPRVMKTVRENSDKKQEKKKSLTMEEQSAFTKFMDSSPRYKHWSNILTVLLGTGLRIGECLGLTWQNCNFDEGIIEVTHTLNYRQQEDGHCRHYVEPVPKTDAGEREIPMFDEVRTALLEEKAHQEKVGTAGTVIDGVSGWCFTNRYGTVFLEKSINNAIERIRNAYNKTETATAKQEGRKPFLLPHFTCHQLRHTFCTRLVEVEPNPKIAQAYMGHKKFDTTMDIYTDVHKQTKIKEAGHLQGKFFIK